MIKKISLFVLVALLVSVSTSTVNAEVSATLTPVKSTISTYSHYEWGDVWYKLDANLASKVRYFDGNDICFVSMWATTDPYTHFNNNNPMIVKLYRDKSWAPDGYIGSLNVLRIWYWKAQWNNVGAWNYYFTISKATDGVIVYDYKVALTNNCNNYR